MIYPLLKKTIYFTDLLTALSRKSFVLIEELLNKDFKLIPTNLLSSPAVHVLEAQKVIKLHAISVVNQ